MSPTRDGHLLWPPGEREVLALGDDREKVYDMHTFAVDERICEDGRDSLIRCVGSWNETLE